MTSEQRAETAGLHIVLAHLRVVDTPVGRIRMAQAITDAIRAAEAAAHERAAKIVEGIGSPNLEVRMALPRISAAIRALIHTGEKTDA